MDHDPARPYRVMGYFAGLTLEEQVRTQEPLPEMAARLLVVRLAEGMTTEEKQRPL